MLDRLYLVFFLLLFASPIFANEANWNCQQDKNTKEWSCVGSANAASKPSVSAPPKVEKLVPAKQEDLPQVERIPAKVESPAQKTVQEAAQPHEQLRPVETKPVQNEGVADVEASPKTIENASVPTETTLKQTPPAVVERVVAEAPPPLTTVTTNRQETEKSKIATASETRKQGWNCDNKGTEGNWNCQLVGPDPKGEASIVEADEHKFSLFTPAFDDNQERTFNTLRDRLPFNPWAQCTMQLGNQKFYVPGKNIRDISDLDMDSNYAEIYDNQIGTYQGNVDMKRADQKSSSNSANYDSISKTLDLHGNVFYSEDELALYTDTVTLKLDTDEARLRDSLFISPTTPLRGKANAVYRDSKTFSRYKDVSFTACEPGNQDVVMHASDLKMNKITGKGSSKNTWLEFKGVPVLYSPYMSFPIDDRRKTGFLAPSFNNTSKGGFSFSAPFYWNIAPNYDATIRPKEYIKRGTLLAGDFRYLTSTSKGKVTAEYMPHDSIRGNSRYLASIKNISSFTPNLHSTVDLNYVSDKAYFSELGTALSFPNFSHIRSYADLTYARPGVSFIGLMESWETIDPTLTGRLRPYRRLPQLDLNFAHSFDSLPVPANTALETEYVYFQHDNSSVPDGQRINAKPSVSFPFQNASSYVTPKLSLQYTHYLLNNQAAGVPNSIGRTVPIASVDSGLFFEKNVNLFGNSLLHTLEPRLFYLYIPKVNQNNIPIFDSSLYDFWYSSLFRENRFSGTDRIQDANQVTAALTSRLVDSSTGLEKLRVNIGEIFYFRNREVTAPVVRIGNSFLETPVQTSTFSPIVAELSSQINKHVAIETGLQWDPHINDIVRGKAVVHFVRNPGEIINAGFLYRKNTLIKDAIISANDPAFNQFLGNNAVLQSNDIIQTDASFRWPIYDNWFGVGRWQYSLLYHKTQEVFLGLEKETCCWRFRIIGRGYTFNLNNNVNTSSDLSVATVPGNLQTGIFFQIEFKGLTGFGQSLDDFFVQSIYGYRKSGK